MGSPEELRVGFGRQVVAVRTSDRELAAMFATAYGMMRAPEPVVTALAIELEAAGDAFVGRTSLGSETTRPSRREIARWARQELLETMVRGNSSLLWMHGAVVRRGERALLITGERGQGKSTLAAALHARGWWFVSDDVVPLDPEALAVQPFLRRPEVRRDPGRAMPHEWLTEAEKEVVELSERVERAPRPVGGIVLAEAARDGDTVLEPCAPSDAVLALAHGCWNFNEHGAAGAAALSRLVSTVPLARLHFSAGADAADALEAWASAHWDLSLTPLTSRSAS